MSIHHHIDDPIDQLDAAVFSGDLFLDDERREAFRQIMARWERAMKSFDEISEAVANEEFDDDDF